MEGLLKYVIYKVSWMLFTAEGIIVAVCVFGIIFTRLYNNWKTKRAIKKRDALSKLIRSVILQKSPLSTFSIPRSLRNSKILIETLEEFDARLTDPIWIELKEKVFHEYLKSFISQNRSSFFWKKRQLAARLCLLFPHKASEKDLSKLLKDNKFLVRVVAAASITKTNYKELFDQVIRTMSKEAPLSRFSYRDAIMQSDSEKFKWIQELLKNEKNPEISAICLDILSTRMTQNFIPLLKPFVSGTNRECKLLAINALGNIPSQESIELLLNCLDDSDSEVRGEAIKGLAKLSATSAIPKIKPLLADPEWWVRLQAALGLKILGEKGREILTSINSEQEPKAFEIARYVLSLPT